MKDTQQPTPLSSSQRTICTLGWRCWLKGRYSNRVADWANSGDARWSLPASTSPGTGWNTNLGPACICRGS